MQTAAVVCTVALVGLSPPPRVCLPRAQIFLAAGSEHDAARGAGRGAASLQKIIDGEATLEEAQLELARQRHTAGLQTMVDRGDAATLEEAQLMLSRQGHAALMQNMVDRGEAATLEAAQQVLSRRAQLATAQRIVDRGEAASLDEAQQLLARRRREAFEAKYSFEDIYKISSASGIKTAKKRGFRTRYPGVRWQKKQDKKTGKTLDEGTGSFPESSRGFWRVAFRYKGKDISVGSGYEDEEAAARAHDDYVRKHKLQRRLHFPRAGEGGGVGAEA